jgi:hypothetical protein
MPNLPPVCKVVCHRRISTSGLKNFRRNLLFRAFYAFSAGIVPVLPRVLHPYSTALEPQLNGKKGCIHQHAESENPHARDDGNRVLLGCTTPAHAGPITYR